MRPGATNKIEPGKRPLSSISPTIVTKDNQVVLVTGSPGGSTIPTTVLQVISNAIDYGLDINEAFNNPRFHYQGFPNRIIAEPEAISLHRIKDLELRGYAIITNLFVFKIQIRNVFYQGFNEDFGFNISSVHCVFKLEIINFENQTK